MTQKVNPSYRRPAEAFKTAGAIAYGDGEGYIVEASDPTPLSAQDSSIDETAFTAFDQTSSGSSLDVTIGPGEAFVLGSWLAIDTSTTVSLSSSTSNQTVYLGWDKDSGNTVIIGKPTAFSETADNTDPKIPLWTFDTDGSGVTSVTDERPIGLRKEFGGNIQLSDDRPALFGDDSDFSLSYNSSTDELEVIDESNDVVKQTFDKSGDVTIPNGALNFADSHNIQDSGTDVIQFNGTGTVGFPNGNVNIGTNSVVGDSGELSLSGQATLSDNDCGEISFTNNGPELIDSSGNTQLSVDSSGSVIISSGSVMPEGTTVSDDGGTDRVSVTSTETTVHTESGSVALTADDNNNGAKLTKYGTGELVSDASSSLSVLTYRTGSQQGAINTNDASIEEMGDRVATRVWATGSNIQHSELADAPASAHHAKTTSAADLTDVSSDSVSGAHHSKTTSASELTDVSADSVAGAHHSKTTSASELSDVSADSVGDAHHGKTTSAADLTDVSPDSDTDAHHTKTTTAAELSDVSADSVGDAHHSRYADSEAISAIEGVSTLDLSGSLEVGATTTIDGNSVDIDGDVQLTKNTVGSDQAADLHGYDEINLYIDKNSTNGLQIDSVGNVNAPNGTLSELGNRVATRAWATGSNIQHSELADAPASAHHTRYADSEALSAVESTGLTFDGSVLETIGFSDNTLVLNQFGDRVQFVAKNNDGHETVLNILETGEVSFPDPNGDVKLFTSRLSFGQNGVDYATKHISTNGVIKESLSVDATINDRDILESVEVVPQNRSSSEETNTITVEVYEGTESLGTKVLSLSKDVTLGPEGEFDDTDRIYFFEAGSDDINLEGTNYTVVASLDTDDGIELDEITARLEGADYRMFESDDGFLSIENTLNEEVLRLRPTTQNVTIPGGFLKVADGIQDALGTPRLSIDTDETVLRGPGGLNSVTANKGVGVLQLTTNSDYDFRIFDNVQDRAAVLYKTAPNSTSAGVFALQNADFSIPTGREIQDETGTERIYFQPGSTNLYYSNGELGLRLNPNDRAEIRTYSGVEFGVEDQAMGETGYQYEPDSTVGEGVLDLENSGLQVQGSGKFLSNGIQIRHLDPFNTSLIEARRNGSTSELQLKGDPVRATGDHLQVENGTVVDVVSDTILQLDQADTWFRVPFDNEANDQRYEFDSTTQTFTPDETMWYDVDVSVAVTDGDSNSPERFLVEFYDLTNGTTLARMSETGVGATDTVVSISRDMLLDAGVEYEVRIKNRDSAQSETKTDDATTRLNITSSHHV